MIGITIKYFMYRKSEILHKLSSLFFADETILSKLLFVSSYIFLLIK